MINAGKHEEVARRMLSFNKAGGKTLPGLVSRRKQESELYLSGGGQESAQTTTSDLFKRQIVNNAARYKKLFNRKIAMEEREDEQHYKEARQQREREGFELVSKGELTREWLDKHENELTTTAHNRFQLYLRKGKRRIVTDPETYANLLKTLETDPQRAAKDAVEAYGRGQLSQSNMNRILSQSRKEKKYPREVEETRRTLRNALRPKYRDADAAKRYMEAVNDYDDFIDETLEAGGDPKKIREAIQGRAEQLMQKYKGDESKARRSELQMPSYSQVSRENMNEEALNVAIQRLLQARKTGKIDQKAFETEAKILKQWVDLLKEEAANDGK